MALIADAVIVSWNVQKYLDRCLGSLVAADQGEGVLLGQVIVVDNASTDGTAVWLRNAYPQVHLIANQENRGFAAGCNQGLARTTADAVLLLNPDAELLPGALEILARVLETHPGVAAAGPLVLGSNGYPQPTRRRFPTFATALIESTFIQDHFPNLNHLRRYYCQDLPPDEEHEVDWLVGACLLVRRIALMRPVDPMERSGAPSPPREDPTLVPLLSPVGVFDERFFMYFEEVDWFLRARGAGWRTLYVPSARAVHHGGASSAQEPRQAHLYFLRSKRAFCQKHYSSLAAWGVHAGLLLSYVLRTLEDAAKLALGHRPRLRRDRIALYLSVLGRAVRP